MSPHFVACAGTLPRTGYNKPNVGTTDGPYGGLSRLTQKQGRWEGSSLVHPSPRERGGQRETEGCECFEMKEKGLRAGACGEEKAGHWVGGHFKGGWGLTLGTF